MEHYAGLDVSLKEIAICVAETVARGVCPADPEGVASWFRNRELTPRRIVHVRLAGRRGFRKAAVATARKIAVLMLWLWKNGTDYQWTEEATA
ncbi:MAG: hypothetical protein HLUCCA12_18185 [Rhodobacteraceae bacterium HLUCCA12]|nr:MAG: hypothetical protein HLUCCA12_18185 [Rhodobacteraceae bacterium HLUCCA12]